MPSSSRNRSKGYQPPPAQLPEAWGNWEWNDTYKQYYRYRKIAATGNLERDYEYQYDQQQTNETPRSHDPAATVAAASTAAEASAPPGEAPHEPSYTSDPPIDNLGAAFYRTNLSTVNEAQTPAGEPTYTVNYASGRARSNSFSAGPSIQRNRGGGVLGSRFVKTEDSTTHFEPLDPSFVVHQSLYFEFGKVFKVLWSEPTGSTGTEITGYQPAKYGEKAYHSIRRFVVVDTRHPGHSICLPILTYGGKGTTKKGVRDASHAIIFTGKGPSSIKGERITKPSIRMVPNSPQHHLDSASRINYSKLYTVEHNVKVNFIGAIKGKYAQQVILDYNATHPLLPSETWTEEKNDDEVSYAAGPTPEYPGQQTTPLVNPEVPEENNYVAGDDDLYDASD